MGPIRFKTWFVWALLLFILGVLADYYFLHILFHEKPVNSNLPHRASLLTSPTNLSANRMNPAHLGAPVPEATSQNSAKNSFLESLQKCAPEIAAQAIATPEALMEYLKKSIGVKRETILVDNYHQLLKDGTPRRIQVITADSTNSQNKTEIRLFKLDAEGYPEPLPLKENETLDSLLSEGTLTTRETKYQVVLDDNSSVNLEMHNNIVFEFQYTNRSKVLSCREKDCQCP